MSKTNGVFTQVPVYVQDRSGFDLSHENLFTAKVGTLIPASVEEVLPGDVISIGASMSVELPPLATNFKGRVDAKLETFFVPNRIIWAGWQDFITKDMNNYNDTSYPPGYTVANSIPRVSLNSTYAKAGTLADYLGYKLLGATQNEGQSVNALPFLAYKKIVDDWYKDTNIQKPFFYNGLDNSGGYFYAAGSPCLRTSGVLNVVGTVSQNGSVVGNDGTDLRGLNQRCFAKDYFTTMTTAPQMGAAAELSFSTTVDDDDSTITNGSFSIASLRAANSLQKWLERNNIAGTRYYDQILAHFGVLPSDANVSRAVLLGQVTTPVIVNSVMQQAQIATNGQASNPYAKTTGAKFGNGVAFDKGRLVDNFEVKEHGFIITIFSLVPHAYYGTGVRRYLLRDKSSSFAFPEFANIGDQAVYKQELDVNETVNSTAGYNQRYSEYKFHPDEIHGLLRDNESLSSFALQRNFSGFSGVSSTLVTIPTTYMDSVMVTTSGVSGFNAIVDCYFDSKALRVLPEYSLPSL